MVREHTQTTSDWDENCQNHSWNRIQDSMQLSYSEELPADVAPRHVCVKGGFVAELRLLGLVSAYHREAEFYYHLAPLLNIRLPKCWYAGTIKDQGIVVLEDLIAANNTFGSTIEAWPVQRVSAGLEQLAILHGTTSGPSPLEKYPWGVTTHLSNPSQYGIRSRVE